MSDDFVVNATGVTKRYGRLAPALANISFSANRGSIVVLAGANGCGKSTLLRCIAGLAKHSGTIEVCGRTVDGSVASRRALGYLPQAVTLPQHATIDEAIVFFARLRGADPYATPLPDGFLRGGGTRIGTLSGGQKQRLALAIALLGHPELLLLDEPVANLDEDGRVAVWEMLSDLRAQGTTTLIASPSPADLAQIGDRTIILREGRIIEDRQEVRA
jgi:ABC-type multidrug transport system ATPase subunit